MEDVDKAYWLYVVECSDQSLYTGITTNVSRRIKQHNDGIGAKYTRGRGPVSLIKCWKFTNRSEASKAEISFKKLSRKKKLKLLGEGKWKE